VEIRIAIGQPLAKAVEEVALFCWPFSSTLSLASEFCFV
jgi:hypothetical protein